ncbi:SRPBCC family protein [Marinimicrobium locisalis]|uniref:SRPBCC family protein n=1 Tax=Marinimicrobium locisalis TaxID=546022 RepID=UPI003221D5C1
MQNSHEFTSASPTTSKSNNLGVVGALGLLAGTAWYLKRHTGTQHSSDDSSSNSPWLLGVLGAGLAGAAVGATMKKDKSVDARGQSDVRLASQVIIDRPPEEVYRYWKDLRHLPRVMNFIKQVEPQEGNISHWVAQGPVGPTIEWDSEIVEDAPNKVLSWRSLEDSELTNWGTVAFSPRNNGQTELSIAFNFSPPENMTGTVAKFLTGLENASLDQNLLNLKSQLESGGGTSTAGGANSQYPGH